MSSAFQSHWQFRLKVLAATALTICIISSSAHGMYDPKHGRWLQRDPDRYVDAMNLYDYARSKPCSVVDPDGRKIVAVLASEPQVIYPGFVFDPGNAFDWLFYRRPRNVPARGVQWQYKVYHIPEKNQKPATRLDQRVEFTIRFGSKDSRGMLQTVRFYHSIYGEWFGMKLNRDGSQSLMTAGYDQHRLAVSDDSEWEKAYTYAYLNLNLCEVDVVRIEVKCKIWPKYSKFGRYGELTDDYRFYEPDQESFEEWNIDESAPKDSWSAYYSYKANPHEGVGTMEQPTADEASEALDGVEKVIWLLDRTSKKYKMIYASNYYSGSIGPYTVVQ